MPDFGSRIPPLANYLTSILFSFKKCFRDVYYCPKLPPATGNYTTLHVEVSTTEVMEDICPYSKTEAQLKPLHTVL